MRTNFFQIFIIFATIVGLSQAALAGGKLSTKIKYYRVSGSSAASLHRNTTVPTGFFSSERAYANIAIKTTGFKGTLKQRNRCQLRGFGINASFLIKLPKLAPGTKISRSLRRKFNGFVAFVRRHENTHRRIWSGCFRRAERKIRSLRMKSCDRLVNKAATIYASEWARCKVANARFDRSERARLRRQPLVRAAFKKPRRKTASKRRTRRKGATRTRTNFN